MNVLDKFKCSLWINEWKLRTVQLYQSISVDCKWLTHFLSSVDEKTCSVQHKSISSRYLKLETNNGAVEQFMQSSHVVTFVMSRLESYFLHLKLPVSYTNFISTLFILLYIVKTYIFQPCQLPSYGYLLHLFHNHP